MNEYINYPLLIEYIDYVISCICLGNNNIISFKEYCEDKDLDDYYKWLNMNTLNILEEDKEEWF